MNLKECYAAMGGDYESAVGRLGERLIHKFAVKFLADGSFELLRNSMAEGNIDEAFRAAHTLKGVCGNLGFAQLGTSAAAMTEALRGGDLAAAQELYPAVERDYQQTIAAIQSLE